MEYCQGKRGEYTEIIPFINEVFGENFPVILPKTYGADRHFEEYHQLVKEDGVLTALIGNYEQDFYIGDRVLRTGCVGSVSVAKRARGRGYMKLLMKKTEEAMRAHQVDLAFLGGLRNRYGFFGFEKGGYTYDFHFNEANIRQTIGWEEDAAVEIRPVTEKDPVLDEMYALYRKNQFMWCRSREEFLMKSRTWNNEVFQVRIEDTFAGYYAAKGGCIVELELSDWNHLLRVAKACMVRNREKSLSVQVVGWHTAQVSALYQACEHYTLRTGCSYKILNYPNVLAALLEVKKQTTKLEDGILTIAIQETDSQDGAMMKTVSSEKTAQNFIGIYRITVQNQEVTVEETAEVQPDLILTEREAVTVLLSPAGQFYLREKKDKLKNWFPAEFSISNLDEF